MPRGRPRGRTTKDIVDAAAVNPALVQSQALDAVFADTGRVGKSRRPYTPEEREAKQEAFLSAYQRLGYQDEACLAADVHFSTVNDWKNKDEVFAERFNGLGKAALVTKVESRLARIALGVEQAPSSSVTAAMAILNAEASDKYRPRTSVDMNVRVMADYKGFANRNGEGN
jgi:hypothetical protein